MLFVSIRLVKFQLLIHLYLLNAAASMFGFMNTIVRYQLRTHLRTIVLCKTQCIPLYMYAIWIFKSNNK